MAKRVNTATLIRGKILHIRHPNTTPEKPEDSLRFEINKPEIVEDSNILKMLEDMYEEIEDGEGEVFEKPVFLIERGVAPPEDPNAVKTKRLEATRKVKTRRRRVA